MFGKSINLFITALVVSTGIFAQSRPSVRQQTSPTPPPENSQYPNESEAGGGMPDEMRVRMLIARRENEYKKVMEQVNQLSDLSDGIAFRFHQQGKLNDVDVKNLSQIEKLARQVLSHAGGDQVEDKDNKPTLADAVDQIATAAAKIKKDMTAETRYVVSAEVISSTNQVINLSRYVRRFRTN